MSDKYVKLGDLLVYKFAIELGDMADVFMKFLNKSEQTNFQINRFIKTTYDSKDQGGGRQ